MSSEHSIPESEPGASPPPVPEGFDDPTFDYDELEFASDSPRKKLRLYCFHCNRPETHSNAYMGAWFYSYFIGLTFGLLHLFGPYRCQCCGRERLMFRDWANPKYHAVRARNRAAAPSRRSR